MTVQSTVQRPNAQAVREWAKENGITEGYGPRGRISPEVVRLFNKGKRGRARYVETEHSPTVTVTVQGKRGNRLITRDVNLASIRQAARDAGIPVGERGRLPQEVLRAGVLGTLPDLAEQMRAEAAEAPADEAGVSAPAEAEVIVKVPGHKKSEHRLMEGTFCPTCGQRLPGK